MGVTDFLNKIGTLFKPVFQLQKENSSKLDLMEYTV